MSQLRSVPAQVSGEMMIPSNDEDLSPPRDAMSQSNTSSEMAMNDTEFDCVNGFEWLRDSMFWVFAIVVAIIAIISWVAGAGSLDSDWYNNLVKPDYTPPVYVIYVIWFAFYFVLAYLGYGGYALAKSRGIRAAATALFLAQLGLNLAWMIVFFGQQNPAAAFWIAIVLFIISLLWTILLVFINRALGILGILYTVWTAIISIWTWQILVNNAQ